MQIKCCSLPTLLGYPVPTQGMQADIPCPALATVQGDSTKRRCMIRSSRSVNQSLFSSTILADAAGLMLTKGPLRQGRQAFRQELIPHVRTRTHTVGR